MRATFSITDVITRATEGQSWGPERPWNFLRGPSKVVVAVALGLIWSVVAGASEGQLATAKLQKAAVKCQKIVAQVTAKVVTGKFKALDACANAALTCVQTKQAQGGPCLTKAGQTCAKKLNAGIVTLDKAQAKIVAAKSCAVEIPFLDLLSADGLGMESLAEPCQVDFGLNICGGLDPLAKCLRQIHERAAGALYGTARPRTAELLARLADVFLPPVDGLPAVPPCATCVGTSPNPKGVEQCGRALTKATGGMVASLEQTFGTCAQKVLACIQVNVDEPACLAAANKECDKGAGTISAIFTKFAATVAKKCNAAVVDFGQLAAASGLNLAATSCATTPHDIDALTACVQQRAKCRVAELVQRAVSRVRELGDGGQLGNLGPDLMGTCPVGAASASAPLTVGARLSLFGSITKIIKRVTRQPSVGPVMGTVVPGGRPSSTGAGRPGVRLTGTPTQIRFGGITKIPFRYTIGGPRGGSSSLRQAANPEPPTMIVTVRRSDVALEDHFEIVLEPAPAVSTDVADELEVEYQDVLPLCGFTLELAIRDDGVVGDYTSLPQVVGVSPPAPTRFVDNGDGTVTDTQTGLQWEKKRNLDGVVNLADPHDADNKYSWTAFPSSPPYPPNGTAFTDFIAKLNAAHFGGHSDWRLPTMGRYGAAPELESIRLTPPPCAASPCIDAIFGPTVKSVYWSATSDYPFTYSALLVQFANGEDRYAGSKTDSFAVRAVRTGP